MLFIAGIALPTMSSVQRPSTADTLSAHRFVVPDSLQPRYLYADGVKKYIIAQDTIKAESLFCEVLALDSAHAPSLYQLATIYLGRDNARAFDYARRAYEQDTMNNWSTSLYGHTLIYNNRLPEALRVYRRLLDIDPSNQDNYRILAILYQQSQQPYAAISVLDSADTHFGKTPYLSEMKQHLLLSTHQYDRAIEEAQQAVDIAPYDQQSRLTLGKTYAAAGRDSLARVTMHEAYKMDSTSVEALLEYSEFLRKQNDVSGYLGIMQLLFRHPEYPLHGKLEMLSRYMNFREMYADNYYTIGNLALILHSLYPTEKRVVDLYGEHLLAGGYVEPALLLFKEHLSDEPPQLDYYMAVIDLEEYQNRPDSVDIYVAKAMTLFEGKPELYIRKANRQYIKGDLHGAVSSFEEALTYAQNDTMRGEVWGFIGDTYHQIAEERALRDAEKKAHHEADSLTEAKRRLYPIRISEKKAMQRCYEAYEKSLSLHAENASVLNNYAYFLSEEHRDLERALAMSSQAIHLEQNNATFLDTYAWILHLLGRNEEAQTYMRRALSLDDTKSPELPLHYGDILYALGNKFMAKTYWQKALQLGADKVRIEQRMKLIE